jgi:hypothetical protein
VGAAAAGSAVVGVGSATGAEVAVAWGVSPTAGAGWVAAASVAVGAGVAVAAELQASAMTSNQGMKLMDLKFPARCLIFTSR